MVAYCDDCGTFNEDFGCNCEEDEEEAEERIKKMNIEELTELSSKDFKCDHIGCEHYENYNQCYNHSHAICKEYQEFAILKTEKRIKYNG